MTSIAEIRQQYPQYGDMSDSDLASALHQKFYSDMPVDEFNNKVGLSAAPKEQPKPEGWATKLRRAAETSSPMASGLAASLPFYEPVSPQAKLLKKAFSLPEKTSKAVGGGATDIASASGLPAPVAGLVGAGAETATMAATLLTPGGRAKAAETAVTELAPRAESALKEIIQKAVGLGYKLKPSEAGGMATAPKGTIAEGLANSAKIETAALVHNQTVTDKLAITAARKAGLAADARLSRPSIEAAIKSNGKPYAEVSRILGDLNASPEYLQEIGSVGRRPGTTFEKVTNQSVDKLKEGYAVKKMKAPDVVFEIRKLRQASGRNIVSPKPEEQELGHAQRAIAEAMENELERQATAIGRPDLVPAMQEARTNIAKLHDIKSALKGNSVDAKKIAKLGERRPLTGELKDIADVSAEFPNVTRHAGIARQKVPVTMVEGAGAGISAATSHPAVAAAFVARPLARKALLSDTYQRTLSQPAKLKSLEEKARERMLARRGATLAETEQQ